LAKTGLSLNDIRYLKANQRLLMLKKVFLIGFFMVAACTARSQVTPVDTIPSRDVDSAMLDDDIDYDELFNDFDLFLDSLLKPRSFFLVNMSAAAGYFTYKGARNTDGLVTKKKLVLSPTIGYYHKSGLGITTSANIIRNPGGNHLYQRSITPSFDLIQNKKWAGGLSFTRYFTKDSLPFYTTPLHNEINAYYLWRDAWLQPGIAASYGWGSRSDLKKTQEFKVHYVVRKRIAYIRRNTPIMIIDTVKLIETITTTVATTESIVDVLLTPSVRHTFYWLNLSRHNDYIKFTPMLALSFGTQQFGLNQTTARSSTIRNAANVQFSRGDVNFDEKMKFQLLSLTLYLRPEYSIGKFFVQPQLMFDYYFPGEENKFTTFFSINAGFMF
jgi:hypothetical protein